MKELPDTFRINKLYSDPTGQTSDSIHESIVIDVHGFIEEALSNEADRVLAVIFSTYTVRHVDLTQMHPSLFKKTSTVKVLIFHGQRGYTNTVVPENVRIAKVTPRVGLSADNDDDVDDNHAMGVHHAKYHILICEHGIHVIITTANISLQTSVDTSWHQYFPKASARLTGKALKGAENNGDFGTQLENFILQQSNQVIREQKFNFKQWLKDSTGYEDICHTFDFSSAKVSLVATVPGRYFATPFTEEETESVYRQLKKDIKRRQNQCAECLCANSKVTPSHAMYGLERLKDLLVAQYVSLRRPLRASDHIFVQPTSISNNVEFGQVSYMLSCMISEPEWDDYEHDKMESWKLVWPSDKLIHECAKKFKEAKMNAANRGVNSAVVQVDTVSRYDSSTLVGFKRRHSEPASRQPPASIDVKASSISRARSMTNMHPSHSNKLNMYADSCSSSSGSGSGSGSRRGHMNSSSGLRAFTKQTVAGEGMTHRKLIASFGSNPASFGRTEKNENVFKLFLHPKVLGEMQHDILCQMTTYQPSKAPILETFRYIPPHMKSYSRMMMPDSTSSQGKKQKYSFKSPKREQSPHPAHTRPDKRNVLGSKEPNACPSSSGQHSPQSAAQPTCTCYPMAWWLLTSACLSIGAQGQLSTPQVCDTCHNLRSRHYEYRNFELGVLLHSSTTREYRALHPQCAVHSLATASAGSWRYVDERGMEIQILPAAYDLLGGEAYCDEENNEFQLRPFINASEEEVRKYLQFPTTYTPRRHGNGDKVGI